MAEDWITLWQSEISALAADRELAEGWAAWAAFGAAWMRAAATPPPRRFQAASWSGSREATASPPSPPPTPPPPPLPRRRPPMTPRRRGPRPLPLHLNWRCCAGWARR
ncbi:hypothetical protein [Teichococcus aestuarii]|uniref:hypothetical protein n=1 Tax=Teichococcus aestuarii TaxID=568898 RepID=UPI0036233925